MAGLDRQRAVDRKRRKRGGGEPFATMPPGHLLAAALGLSPCALRLLLLAHAGWLPGRDAKQGSAMLPYRRIVDPRRSDDQRGDAAPEWRPSTKTITKAIKEASDAGFVVRLSEGTRPRGPGGNGGLAATFAVPIRDGDHAAARLHLPPGMRAPKGKLRMPSRLIRNDCAALSPLAFRLLIFVVARGDRDAGGNLLDTNAFPLSARDVAGHLGISTSAAAEAIGELAETGRLMLAVPAAGSRPASYNLHRRYCRGLSG